MAGEKYVESSNFTFSAGSIKDIPVKEFSNLGMAAPPTEHSIGSMKRGQTYAPQPSPVKPTNPTIVLVGSKDKKVYDWYEKCNPALGGKRTMDLREAKLSLMSEGQPVLEYQIKNCYPCKYDLSSMSSDGGALVTETIELVCEQITRES
jgi:phage tail-like protein